MKAKYAKNNRLPGWLFLVGMSVYVELLLHLWTADALIPGRLATVVVFGLAFGWLYRKYGLRYAMIAHGGCHVVSKLIWILFI